MPSGTVAVPKLSASGFCFRTPPEAALGRPLAEPITSLRAMTLRGAGGGGCGSGGPTGQEVAAPSFFAPMGSAPMGSAGWICGSAVVGSVPDGSCPRWVLAPMGSAQWARYQGTIICMQPLPQDIASVARD